MNATNGIGWEVQRFNLGLGWLHFSGIYPTKELAQVELKKISDPAAEYRVYEALQCTRKK